MPGAYLGGVLYLVISLLHVPLNIKLRWLDIMDSLQTYAHP